MLNKKLIVGSCLAVAVLAGQSAFATTVSSNLSAPPTVTMTCPADAFISQTNHSSPFDVEASYNITLGLCKKILGRSIYNGYLARGTDYWIRTTPEGNCPPGSGSVPATDYSSAKSYLVAIPNQEPIPVPTNCGTPIISS